MRWSRTVTVYGVHAEGEVGRVVTGGVVDIPGKTMLDKLRYLNEEDDSIRRFTLFEPRGSAQMSVNLLLPPTRPDADAGFIVMQPDRCHPLSGSNTMCVVTLLLETGMLPMKEPTTVVTLDTAAGLVRGVAACRNGKVESVTVDMVPSFVEALDVPVNVDNLGEVQVDIGFGGCYFAMIDTAQVSVEISPAHARELVDLGSRVKHAVRRTVTVQHPEIETFNSIDYVMFVSRGDKKKHFRNATIIHPGRVDRSPCGVGSSARLAVMHARGMLGKGEKVFMESTIGGVFQAEIVGNASVGDRPAIIPRLTGRAWIYAIEHLGVDPTDPYPFGYTMSDTWGPDADEAFGSP